MRFPIFLFHQFTRSAMSNVNGALPIRGQTLLSGNANRTLTATMGADREGSTMDFDDVDPTASTGARQKRSNRRVTCILVRNEAAAAVLPKFIVKWKSGQRGHQIDGYSCITNEAAAGVVDEFLGSGGAAVHDLFWIAVKGPTLIKTPLEGDATNVIGLDDLLGALTAVTSGSTTAGRVLVNALTATSTATTDGKAGAVLMNSFGRALSAKTTANTNADVLVDVFFMK